MLARHDEGNMMAGGKTEKIQLRVSVTEKRDMQTAAQACGYPSLTSYLISAGYEKVKRDLDVALAEARADLEAEQNGAKPVLEFKL